MPIRPQLLYDDGTERRRRLELHLAVHALAPRERAANRRAAAA
jgi:hypothetical protein